MNRKAKIYGGIGGIVLVLFAVSRITNISTVDDLFVLSAVLGGIGIAGKYVKDSKIREKLSQVNQSNTGIKFGMIDCREIAQEWARQEYSGKIKSKKGMSFDWTQAETDIAPVYDFSEKEWIHVRYFYTQYGPKNKGTLIFVDATNGEPLTSKPVHQDVLKEEPFEHLEMYRMTKSMRSRIAMGGADDQRQVQGVVNGIPVQQFPQPSQDEGGDN